MLEIAENMKGLVRQPFSFVWTRSDRLKIKEGSNSMDHFGSFFFVVQIKGSKRLTHSQEATLNISAKEAMKNFKRLFTGLDWDYMNIPKYGQVLCDVGITIQPDHPEEELVGLW
jgi:hypothetical protein